MLPALEKAREHRQLGGFDLAPRLGELSPSSLLEEATRAPPERFTNAESAAHERAAPSLLVEALHNPGPIEVVPVQHVINR